MTRRVDNSLALPPRLRDHGEDTRFFDFGSLKDTSTDVQEIANSTGTTVTDLSVWSGSANPPEIIPGWCGRALQFDGEVMEGPGTTALQDLLRAGDWTAQCFYRPRVFPTGSAVQVIGYVGGDVPIAAAADNGLLEMAVLENGAFRYRHYNGTGSPVTVTTDDFLLRLYDWHHLVLTGTDDGGTITVRFYINGVEIASFSGGTLAKATGGTAANVYLGGHPDAGAGSNLLNGDICHFDIQPGVLTLKEIQAETMRADLQDVETHLDTVIRVKDPNGAWQDMTNFRGKDWLRRVDIKEDANNIVETMTVQFFREIGDMSLAPLRSDSLANLNDPNDPTSYEEFLIPGVDVECLIARLPHGIIDEDGAMMWSRFRGTILRSNPQDGNKIQIECTPHLTGKLSRLQIKNERNYGSAGGIAVETNIQSIITDAIADLHNGVANYGAITVYTPESPGWLQKEFRPKRLKALTLASNLAIQFGGEVRQIFDMNPEENRWRFTLFEPLRDREDADSVLSDRDVLSIQECDLDLSVTRQGCRVQWYDTTDQQPPPAPSFITSLNPAEWGYTVGGGGVDNDGNPLPCYIEIWNKTAIDKYKEEIFMEVSEGTSSEIDTINEGAKMCLGAVKDLKDPPLSHRIRIVPMPELRLYSTILMQANRMYSVDQRLGVQSLQLTIDTKASMTVGLRGKAARGYKRWLSVEARPGQGKPPVLDIDDVFTPESRIDQLKAFTGIRNNTVGLGGGRHYEVRNGSFETRYKGDNTEPQDWELLAGDVWGTDVLYDKTRHITGSASLKFANTLLSGNGLSQKKALEVQDYQPVEAEVVWRPEDYTFNSYRPQVFIDWYDNSGALISTSSATALPSAPTGWGLGNDIPLPDDFLKSRFRFMPPTGTKFACARLKNAGTVAKEMWVDSFNFQRGRREGELRATAGDTQIITTNVWTTLTLWSLASNIGTHAEFANNRILIDDESDYTLIANVRAEDATNQMTGIQVRFTNAGSALSLSASPEFQPNAAQSSGEARWSYRQAMDHGSTQVQVRVISPASHNITMRGGQYIVLQNPGTY